MFSVRPRWSNAVKPALVAVLIASVACGTAVDTARRGGPVTTGAFVDDFGDTLRAGGAAARVVSLNPVTTEAIFAMRADARLVGRTKWDGAPAEAARIASVGDGMQPNIEAVLATRPDLVILYAAEANRAAAAAFRRAGVATLALRTDRVEDFARMMRALGAALGDTIAARTIIDSVTRTIDAVRALPRPAKAVSVFWHAWDAPVITIGGGSFQHELIVAAGAVNVFGDLRAPSPQVTMEAVAQRNPDYVLAGPVSARSLRTDARWQAVAAVRAGRILVVDTALIGRPGVRMGEAARSLRALLDSAAGVAR